jgi:hypothetical protein
VSSAVLYLAIVALWAVVLVPMWLRRDGDPGRPTFSRLLHRRSDAPEEPAESQGAQEAEPEDIADGEADLPVPRRRNSRAAVIARRRRRTWGLSLLVLASITTAIIGLAPPWVALPPAGLLGAHLSLLRVAVGMDLARREEEVALARAAERAEAIAAREAEEAEAAAHAEVIDLMARNKARDVFDQYAGEGLRAVGD